MLVVELQTQQAIEHITRGLTQFEKNKALREGLRDAAKIFEAYGRVNYVERLEGKYAKGATLSSFSTKVSIGRKRDGGPEAVAGLKWPDGYKAHWIDLGTGPRYTKTGAYRGIMPANYFFSDAREEGERPAMDAIYDGIQRAIDSIKNGR